MKAIKPEYQAWRKRIEGQIRHAIHEHPEWFSFADEDAYRRCVNGIAKRIIGEIVAGTLTGGDTDDGGIPPAVIPSYESVEVAAAAQAGMGGTLAAIPVQPTNNTDGAK